MRFHFVEAEKAYYPVRLRCRCLSVSRSGDYAWRSRAPSARSRADARLKVESSRMHSASRHTYGSPRILRDLHDEGHRVSRKRVARLMRELALAGRYKRRFRTPTDSRHRFPVAPNVLLRDFDVDAPNPPWVPEITYVATLEGWLYLAVILDLFSRRVVGFAMSERIDRALVLEALQQALVRRPNVRDLTHHSDRGSQYASGAYREALDSAGITWRMSRRGNSWDHAVAENFFETLKRELLYLLPLKTRADARAAVAEYIEDFYNVRRRHSSRDYMSSIEFELKSGSGALRSAAPEPPFISERGRDPEGLGLTS